MARLVVDGSRYDSLSSSAMFESEYERLLLQEAEQLFPDFRVVPFREPVQLDGVWKKPDIALIDREYREWWVGEVELAHHPLDGHVLPQVEVFARGEYGRKHAEAICREALDLDEERIHAMMRGAQPNVAVIVNQPRPDWIKPLSRIGVELVIVEIFRSPTRRPIFRINGHDLAAPSELVTTCVVDRAVPRMLIVNSPALLQADEDGYVEIAYQGSITTWRVVALGDRTWLSPARTNPVPFDYDGEMRIVVGAGGQMSFELKE